jgi:hypothetical protein
MTAVHPVPPSGSSPSSGSGLDARARQALAEAYRALHPEVPLDPQGYVPRLEDNLLPGVPVEIVRAALAAGAGQELDRKIRAVHSSAALVANCFGPWLREPGRFELAGRRGFETLELEFPCRIFDSPRATPAHLDLLARGPGGIVAIESKLTEHLKPPAPVFRPAYDRFLPAADPWSAWIPARGAPGGGRGAASLGGGRRCGAPREPPLRRALGRVGRRRGARLARPARGAAPGALRRVLRGPVSSRWLVRARVLVGLTAGR